MQTVYLIMCTRKKGDGIKPAKDMYRGTFLSLAAAYARAQNPDKMFLLSGQYGVLRFNEKIERYDLALHEADGRYLESWKKHVLTQLEDRCGDLNRFHFVFLATETYGETFKACFQDVLNTRFPLDGMSKEEAHQFLRDNAYTPDVAVAAAE